MRVRRFLNASGSALMSLGVAIAAIAASRASAHAHLIHVAWFRVGAGAAVVGALTYWIALLWGLLSDVADAAHITVRGGDGGAGGSADGSVGDVVYAGHGGGGGAAAYAKGSVAEGGKGGHSGGPTVFESLARASVGMGIPLDGFITLAGFDPHGPELDQIGTGGDGGGSSQPGKPGGPGLIVLTYERDGKKEVTVCRSDGQATITAKT